MTNTKLTSMIACPHCGRRALEAMPVDACLFFYECKGCGAMLRPKAGDCCVFCSYGDTPCPPVQQARIKGETCCASSQGGERDDATQEP